MFSNRLVSIYHLFTNMLFHRDTKFLCNDGIKYSPLKLIIIVHIEHKEDRHLREVMKAGNEKSDLSTL